MNSPLEKRLSLCLQEMPKEVFAQSQVGLERESLRVSRDGSIAQTSHPEKFGAALTHPHITTDYSEALLEFVTSPYMDKKQMLSFLRDCQTFVYSGLSDEFLWASSMPCVLAGETSIPIAQYGPSNLGKMKEAYRRGLGHRYGRTMQVIAGIHYNFSFSDEFWLSYQSLCGDSGDSKQFVSDAYFRMIRNLQRYGWLIPYLFGASPAVCKSFINNAETDMAIFDESTYYYPFATSLRMSDIGYQNSKEDKAGIHVSYDGVSQYAESLRHAISTVHAPFSEMGVKIDGQYEQLNANLLQIENEYYSSVRPKQLTENREMPINALKARGVQYIELRSLDIDVFEPCGVSEKAPYFLESFMLYCLLDDSPSISAIEQQEIAQNVQDVARMGRKPGLMLQRNGESASLSDWATEIFDQMSGVCDLLDQNNNESLYQNTLAHYKTRVTDPDTTPSAKILSEMREKKEGFYHFSLRKSEEYLTYFKGLKLSPGQEQYFRKLSNDSLLKQQQLELSDDVSFDEFLNDYFSHVGDISLENSASAKSR